MMQTIFRLPWATEQVSDRLDYQKPRPSPMVEIPYLNKFKRKRSDSVDLPLAAETPEPKRQKAATGSFQDKQVAETDIQKTTAAAEMQSEEKKSKPKSKSQARSAEKDKAHIRQAPVDRQQSSNLPKRENFSQGQPPTSSQDSVLDMQSLADPFSQTIQAIINQEILFKHRELRLIEQELAKCQISLEQIRRCQLIPYPGSQGIIENMTSGVGPAIEPKPGFTRPQYAAPWGVTDGPYARHYAKWLVPDPSFDSMHQQQLQAYNQTFTVGAEGRALRGGPVSADHRQSIGGKGRLSRISTGNNFQALPADYPTPKEKAGPLIIKRASDGQFVKLVCTDCHRANFSSAQGFLNHCRIAHHQDYKSHDAAAIACGQPVDSNEVSAQIETQQPSASAVAQPPTNPHLVHPYITGGPPADLRAASYLAKKSAMGSHSDSPTQNSAQGRKEIALNQPSNSMTANSPSVFRASDATSSPFTPSPAAPHLSGLLQRAGSNIDLAQIVAKAKERPEIESEPEESGDESELPTPAGPAPRSSLAAGRPTTAGGVRPMSGIGMSPAPLERPSSRKGHRQPPGSSNVQVRPMSRSINPALPRLAQLPHAEEVPGTPELSPHTLESNPGLVSDRGEDDEDEDAKSEHHPDADGNVRMRDSTGHVKLVDGDMDIVDEAGSDREIVASRPKARKTELGQSSKAGGRRGR